MPSQMSLKDQLNELEKLASRNGLYDAHDWIILQRERIRRMLQEQAINPACRSCGYYHQGGTCLDG